MNELHFGVCAKFTLCKLNKAKTNVTTVAIQGPESEFSNLKSNSTFALWLQKQN